MPSPVARNSRYRFGPFEADPVEGRLFRGTIRIKLQDLPFRLLLMLVERPGEIVTREEVRQRLWPENTFVEFDNSLGVAVRKVRDALGDDADSPHFIETIPRKGYRFLATVERAGQSSDLEKEAAASRQPVQADAANAPGRKASSSASLGIAIGAAVLAIIGFVFFRSYRARLSSEAKSSAMRPAVRRSIAVLGFRNLPGRKEEDWISQAFVEMLGTELAAGGKLRLVSDEDVARVKREFPLGNEDSLAKETLARLRRNPGADVVVLGSYTPLEGKDGSRIRLDVRMQDTASGETIAEDAVVGDEKDLFELAARAGADLREDLGISSLSPDDVSTARAAVPANEAAMRFYAQGNEKLQGFEYVAARDLLQKAIAADPSFPLAHAALSDALWHLGFGARSEAEAQKAVKLSQHLSQEDQLLIEGQYRRSIDDWQRAVEVYRALFQYRPDSLDYGLRLAEAQIHVNAGDAVRTLEVLRALPAPENEDPRIDMTEASAQIELNMTAAQAAARRAIAKGKALGSPLMVARAYGILCQQEQGIGASTDETARDCEKAIQGSEEAGDRLGAARTLSDLTGVYYHQGDLRRAEDMWRTAAKQLQKWGDLEGVAATSNNLGDVFLQQGRLDEAKKFLEAAIPNYRAIEDRDGVALALTDLGEVARLGGDLEKAETTYEEAKATADGIKDKTAQAYVYMGMGDLRFDQGDFGAARQLYEQSLKLGTEAGEQQAISETHVALAQLAVESGNPSGAEESARRSLEQFRKEGQRDDELQADAVLIRVLVAKGKIRDAKEEEKRAEPIAAQSQNLISQLRFALAFAQVSLASDNPEECQSKLQRALKDAQAHGLFGLELEARLLDAEADNKLGHSASAQQELLSLENVAKRKGYGLIARKAAALRR